MNLMFDPTVLSFVDASQGNFLGQDGSSVVFIVNGASRPGDVAVGLGRANRLQGVTGSGVLARIQFQAISVGQTTLTLSRVLAWDSTGNRMGIAVTGTNVLVRWTVRGGRR